MTAGLTEAGMMAVHDVVFAAAQMAVFDGPRQLTDWHPYAPGEDSPSMTMRRKGWVTHIRVETPSGSWFHAPVSYGHGTWVPAGDVVSICDPPWLSYSYG